MTHQTSCLALWAGQGTKALLPDLHGQPVLQRVLYRLAPLGLRAYVLVPWLEEHDGVAGEVSKKGTVRRCHPDERIAMRDLVAHLRVDVGILVQGHAADVDAAEVMLAYWRLQHGFEDYRTARVTALKAQRWLSVSSDEDWGPVRSLEELRRFFGPRDLERDTREIRARVDPAL